MANDVKKKLKPAEDAVPSLKGEGTIGQESEISSYLEDGLYDGFIASFQRGEWKESEAKLEIAEPAPGESDNCRQVLRQDSDTIGAVGNRPGQTQENHDRYRDQGAATGQYVEKTTDNTDRDQQAGITDISGVKLNRQVFVKANGAVFIVKNWSREKSAP